MAERNLEESCISHPMEFELIPGTKTLQEMKIKIGGQISGKFLKISEKLTLDSDFLPEEDQHSFDFTVEIVCAEKNRDCLMFVCCLEGRAAGRRYSVLPVLPKPEEEQCPRVIQLHLVPTQEVVFDKAKYFVLVFNSGHRDVVLQSTQLPSYFMSNDIDGVVLKQNKVVPPTENFFVDFLPKIIWDKSLECIKKVELNKNCANRFMWI